MFLATSLDRNVAYGLWFDSHAPISYGVFSGDVTSKGEKPHGNGVSCEQLMVSEYDNYFTFDPKRKRCYKYFVHVKKGLVKGTFLFPSFMSL